MKIYNAVRIPGTDIPKLITLGREIGKKNPNYQIIETGCAFHSAVPAESIPYIKSLFLDPDSDDTHQSMLCSAQIKEKKRTLFRLIESFFQGSANDTTLQIDAAAREHFFKEMHMAMKGMSDYEIAIIFSVMERVYLLNPSITFYPGHNGTMLMTWEDMAEKTVAWLYDKFQDASYVDNTDGGYILKKLFPELDAKLDALYDSDPASFIEEDNVSDLILSMMRESFPQLEGKTKTALNEFLNNEWSNKFGDDDEANLRLVNDLLPELKYLVAGIIYEDRGVEWDELFSNENSPFGIPAFNGLSMPGYSEGYKNPVWYKAALCNSILDCMVNGYVNDCNDPYEDRGETAVIAQHAEILVEDIEKAYFGKKYVMVILRRGLIDDEPRVFNDKAAMAAAFEQETGWNYEKEYDDFVECDNSREGNLHPESNWDFYDDFLRCYEITEE